MKSDAKIRRFLLDLASEWMEPLGLSDWDIQYEWHHGQIPGHERAAIMSTTANWGYKHGTISVNLPECRGRSKKFLEKVFFHEVGHILCRVLPLPSKKGRACAEEERFCTDLGQVFVRIGKHCYEKGLKAGKAEPKLEAVA